VLKGKMLIGNCSRKGRGDPLKPLIALLKPYYNFLTVWVLKHLYVIDIPFKGCF